MVILHTTHTATEVGCCKTVVVKLLFNNWPQRGVGSNKSSQALSNILCIIFTIKRVIMGPMEIISAAPKDPSPRTNLTAHLLAQTGLCKQDRACGPGNCAPCKPIRAACANCNKSKIQLRKLDLTVMYVSCGHLSCRVFSPVAIFVFFCARGNRKMRESLRSQTWPMPTRSSRELKSALTPLQRVDTHQVWAGKPAKASLRLSLHV